MSLPPPAPYPPYPPYAPLPPSGPPGRGSGLAVAATVLGAGALLLSWVPLVNALAAVAAVVGLALGIPALAGARRGTRDAGLAITGLVASAVALVVVLATIPTWPASLDEVVGGVDGQGGGGPVADVVPLGVPAQVGDYSVTVDAVDLDADDLVLGADPSNEPPAGRYVVTQLTVTYTGTGEGAPGWDLTVVFHGTDGREYLDAECWAWLPDDAFDAPPLAPGTTDSVQFCMDVPPDAVAGGQLSVEPTSFLFPDPPVFYAVR